MLKRWVTKHFQGNIVEEYLDEGDMRRQRIHRTYSLSAPICSNFYQF